MNPGNAGVGVDVRDCVGQLFGMFLRPLRRTDQALFFRIPAAKVEGAARLPSLRQQTADAVDGFQHGRSPTGGIDSPIDPGVTMIPGDHPLIRKFAAGDFANHVPHRALRVVHLEAHVHFR